MGDMWSLFWGVIGGRKARRGVFLCFTFVCTIHSTTVCTVVSHSSMCDGIIAMLLVVFHHSWTVRHCIPCTHALTDYVSSGWLYSYLYLPAATLLVVSYILKKGKHRVKDRARVRRNLDQRPKELVAYFQVLCAVASVYAVKLATFSLIGAGV